MRKRIRLDHILEFKYLRCVLAESGTDEAECNRKVASGGRVSGTIRLLVNSRSLQLECAWVLHDSFLLSVLAYGSETVIWKEKERNRVWAVHMDNLRGLLGIRRMDKFPNARIRKLCGVTKGVDEKIDEGVFRCFGHVERMDNDRTARGFMSGKQG